MNFFDIFSSRIILEECYDNIKNLIRSEEINDERIKNEHEIFK